MIPSLSNARRDTRQSRLTTPVRIESHNYVPNPPLGWQVPRVVRQHLVALFGHSSQGPHEPEEIGDLIRIGSIPAPRSLVGGLVKLNRETTSVTQLSPPERWVLDMVVAQVTDGPKATHRPEMECYIVKKAVPTSPLGLLNTKRTLRRHAQCHRNQRHQCTGRRMNVPP